MKGTFFSSDFITDSNDNLRLLEVNTDTTIVSSDFSNIDLTEFHNVLSSGSLTQLDFIYKPFIHQDLVNHISASVSANNSNITTIVEHAEDANTIYPSAVTDSDDKFILRLAYDESALFDSTYAKNRIEVFNLFTDSGISGSTPGYYHSGSVSGSVIRNFLEYDFNGDNIPDAAIKDMDELHNPIDFYKIGSEVPGETNEERWEEFISENGQDDKLIENFYHNTGSLISGSVTSIRVSSIVYGTDLDVIHIYSGKKPAIFELPTSLSSEVITSQYTNKLSDHHYYEYTTNFIKTGTAGVLDSHRIELSNGTYSTLSDVVVGDSVTSYFISGSPQEEDGDEATNSWSYGGVDFPSGSYITSSDVVFKDEKDLKYNGLIELKVDDDSVFVGVGKQFLIYDSGSDEIIYESAKNINPDNHYFYDMSGSIVDIDEANFYVTTETDLKIVELDVEDTDTYIISGSTAFNSIVSHNAPCFVAGTKISLEDGSLINIEDVKIGDSVLTYNFSNKIVEPQPVQAIGTKKVNSTVTYIFEDGSKLQATLDHPLYCNTHGWVSKNTEYTLLAYNLTTSEVKIGCDIAKQDKTSSKITDIIVSEESNIVYNLKTVAVNHNFYANEYLVHNRGGCFIAGSEIVLGDGSVADIETIEAGHEVLTYNLETNVEEVGVVGSLKEHVVDEIYKISLDIDGELETVLNTTSEHPIFVQNKGWVEADDLELGDSLLLHGNRYLVIDNIEILQEETTVYNLLNVSENHNFFVNGILVHNKF